LQHEMGIYYYYGLFLSLSAAPVLRWNLFFVTM
jgi:hypothetical protein